MKHFDWQVCTNYVSKLKNRALECVSSLPNKRFGALGISQSSIYIHSTDYGRASLLNHFFSP